MIAGIKFSGVFPPKHKSPVGNPAGYYIPKTITPVVPIHNLAVKF
jgi:hypothetical protein